MESFLSRFSSVALIKKRDRFYQYPEIAWNSALNTCSDMSVHLDHSFDRAPSFSLSKRILQHSSTLATWGRYSFSTLLSFIPTPALAMRCITSTRKTVIYTLICRDVGIRIGVPSTAFFSAPLRKRKETLAAFRDRLWCAGQSNCRIVKG